MEPLGNTINSEQRSYQIKKPVKAVLCLNRKDFNEALSQFGDSNRLVGPDYNFYKDLSESDISDIPGMYSSLPAVKQESTLAFWFRHSKSLKLYDSLYTFPDEGYIVLNVNEILLHANHLDFTFINCGTMSREFLLYKAIILHEFCHHCCYINLTRRNYEEYCGHKDANMDEALANLLVSKLWPGPVSFTLAQLATCQKEIWYSLYNILRLRADIINEMLYDLYETKDVNIALHHFSKNILSCKVVGGGNWFVHSGYNAVVFDWKKEGPNIYCGGKVEAVGALFKGIVVSPRIDWLLGRYPPETKIISNEVGLITDYDRNNLPSNIVIIDNNTINISKLFTASMDISDTNERIRQIHTALGI
jgi:hypothetical protein